MRKKPKQKRFEKDVIKNVALFIVAIVAIGLLINALKTMEQELTDNYNHGSCVDCGSDYDITGRWFDNGDGRWMVQFRCPRCGHRGAVPETTIK